MLVTMDSKCDPFSLYYKNIKDVSNSSCSIISMLSICMLTIFQTLIFLTKYCSGRRMRRFEHLDSALPLVRSSSGSQ